MYEKAEICQAIRQSVSFLTAQIVRAVSFRVFFSFQFWVLLSAVLL